MPTEKSPEAIVLKDDNTTQEELRREKLAQALPSREEIEGLLQACQEGRIPLGYKQMPLDFKTLRGPHRLIREIKSNTLRGLTYEVKNTSKIPLILSEEVFALSSGVLAVYLIKRILNPGERSTAYVIAKVIN